jgi:hypothetical protein
LINNQYGANPCKTSIRSLNTTYFTHSMGRRPKKLYPKRNLEGVIAFGKIQRDADVGLMSNRWWTKLREESVDNSVVKDK